MTTAPTPSEKVQRLAITLEIASSVPDMNYVTVPRHVARDASEELRRLQAVNERLRVQVGRFQGIPLPLIEAINAATGSNDWQGDHSPAELLGPACRAITALVERKNACIHKLEMDALDLASENSILKRAETDELEARKPLPLSDAEIIAAQEALALSRSRIGLPCTRCGNGKYRADCNAYHDFHRCDACMHVPMWDADGNELGATGPLPCITG